MLYEVITLNRANHGGRQCGQFLRLVEQRLEMAVPLNDQAGRFEFLEMDVFLRNNFV